MPRRDSEPESLSALLPRVLGELGLSEASDGMRLAQAWQNALGPELAPHCRPESLRRGLVTARVRDSAWMQRLQMEKPRILSALREQLGSELELRFRIGPFESP